MAVGRNRRLSMAAASLLLARTVLGLDNGLGRRPGMGWNNAYCMHCAGCQLDGCSIDDGCGGDDIVRDVSTFINASGLQAAGYHYVNLDACWDSPQRTANGKLQPSPTRFPKGIEPSVELSLIHI